MTMLVYLIVLVVATSVRCIEDYCSQNTYETQGNAMEFTKEPSLKEFAIRGKFKGLHCCAKNYRSIEWLKDGHQYPWSAQLILYPKNENQTIYAQTVALTDAGNYTCVLRNDTIVHSHTIQLEVFDSEKLPDDPKVTFISNNIEAALGQNIRLFCEAFGGSVDLPDAHNDAVWRKSGHNRTIDEEPHLLQRNCSRDDGQTFGTYLTINNLVRSDFGEYLCKITIPGKSIEMPVRITERDEITYLNPNPIPIGKILLIMSAIVFLLLTALILNFQYGLPLRVRLKDSFGSLEDNDGKINDVLVLHASSDTDLALGVLLPTLEAKYSYKCSAQQLSPNVTYWFGEMQGDALKSRRIIALISPALLNEKWTRATVYEAMKQLQALGPRLTCVLLKQLPHEGAQTKNSQGETLDSLLRTINVVCWEREADDKFWLGLRLRLPPKRGGLGEESGNWVMMTAGGPPRLTTTRNSEQSFDNLV